MSSNSLWLLLGLAAAAVALASCSPAGRMAPTTGSSTSCDPQHSRPAHMQFEKACPPGRLNLP